MTRSPDGYRDLDATVEEVAGAHGSDVEPQEGNGVTDRNYRVDEDRGAVLSLFEGPSRGAGVRVHLEAHG